MATQFDDIVSEDETFDVGFTEGSQQAKVWLESTEDFSRMYSLYPNGGNITFWCHNDLDVSPVPGAKRKRDGEVSSTRQAKEEQVDNVYKELAKKHGKMENTKLRLWARMICGGLHDDYTEPPDIPAFSNCKRQKRENTSDALTGAALAICNVLSPKSTNIETKSTCP